MKVIRKFGNKEFSLEKLRRSDSIGISTNSISPDTFVLMEQIHSDKIKILEAKDLLSNRLLQPIPGVDGLITNQSGIFLAVKTADCIPILIWDTKKQIMAALHSGRKGTELNIAAKAIQIMIRYFDCNPRHIEVELGPAICEKCYPVDPETFDRFVSSTGIAQNFPNINLKKVVKNQLQESGILAPNITDIPICTLESSDYFSYRENGTNQRQISVIGML